MNTNRRINPICPKCNQQNTYDIVPNIPNKPEYQLNDDNYIRLDNYTYGNARYYCIDCDYTWKKYRGKKPYDRIKVIRAYTRGYPGPYFNVKMDLQAMTLEFITWEMGDREQFKQHSDLTREQIESFRGELYKCDFVNWAEEYVVYGVLDGGHWSITIEYDTYCEIKTGSNHFPKGWNKFCKVVSDLCGREFY